VVKYHRGRAAVTGRQPLLGDGESGAGIPAPQNARPARIGFACGPGHAFPRPTDDCEYHLDHAGPIPEGNMRWEALIVHLVICLAMLLIQGADPWADSILDWSPGSGGSPGFDDPTTTLGSPTRTTFDGVSVTPFYPAWGVDEMVSIGAGGFISLRFDEPVLDDPNNPHGIDLLLFGNTGFIDQSFPDGVPAGLFGADGGELEVSADGETWIRIPGCETDAAWPTLGWSYLGPYDMGDATHPSDFTRPLSSTLTIDDVYGITWEAVLSHYDGSGGGVGVDLADAGIESICCVRISNPSGAFFAPELDAIVDVSPVNSADVNLDRHVNVSDLLEVIAHWGANDAGRADIDHSGVVDISDLLLTISQWGQTP
jgi:hypothetical protein